MDFDEIQLTPEQKVIQLEKSVTQLSVLYSIAASITITTDADKVLELVLEKALDTLKAEAGAIFFKDNHDLKLKVSRGGEGVFPSHIRLAADDGVAAQVAQTGRALWITQSGSHYTSLDTTVRMEYPVRSIICFPIKIDNRVLGTIYIGRFSPEEFTEQEKWLLNVLANRASVAIESSRLYSELKAANEKLAGKVELANKELLQRMDELKGLYEVAQTMVASMNIDKILNIIIGKANQLAGTNISTLRLLDENSGELLIKASVGVREEVIPLIPLKVGEGIVGEVAQTGTLQIAENLEKDRRFDYFPRELQRVSSEIVVPLKISTRVIGVLVCASEEQMSFTSREVELLNSLANLAAIAIENARLYQKVIQEREEIKGYASVLEKRESELEEANKVKSQFLSMVSHELRTPLTTIIGYLHLLKNKNLGAIDEKQENVLSTIERRANGLKIIIDGLLDISKVDSCRGLELNLEFVNTAKIINDIIFSLKPMADRKGIKIENKVPEDFSEVKCDPNRMAQVFSNLLDNAVKFTDKGKITVKGVSKKNEFEFIVSDTGIGIPPQYVEKIFERFFQVDSSDTRPYGGTGLGLAITRDIVHAHHGIIKAESELKKGSKFIIRIPKFKEEPLKEISAKIDIITVNGSHQEKTILAIDDDNDLLILLETILAEEGFNVITAVDGLEGLKKLYENKVDLILLDIRMPKIDGFDICKIMKKYEDTKNIPVAILSAAGHASDIKRGRLSGADEYIVKPFQPHEVVKSIKKLLKSQAAKI